MANFTPRRLHRWHHRWNNPRNCDSPNLVILFLAAVFTIFMAIDEHSHSKLNIVSGSSMYIIRSSMTSIFYNGYISVTCPSQDVTLGFLDYKPIVCVNDVNTLNYNEYVQLYERNNCESHAHHLNKNDEIIIKSMTGVNVYVFSESEYVSFKKKYNLWNTPLEKINEEHRVIIPYAATFYIVIQSTTFLSFKVKLEYTIRRNVYCSDNYIDIYKCDKQIGFIKKIKIPSDSTGLLITVPTNNVENKWDEEENTSNIIYHYHTCVMTCIFLLFAGVCIYKS